MKTKNILLGTILVAVGVGGYYFLKIYGLKYSVHQIVYLMHHGFIPKEIDHINGIKSDNRIENLRGVTRSQNFLNRGISVSNSSGVKNVCWHKGTKKWSVSISFNKTRYKVGRRNLEVSGYVS